MAYQGAADESNYWSSANSDSPPWHFIQPTYPPRVSNPNSLPAHNVPVLQGSTQPPSYLLLPHTSTWGMTFSPQGCRIHWVEGKQRLQQPALTVQSRTPSWAGWQLSEETRQISAPLQAQKTCCLARPASSSPAQLLHPQQHHHRLQPCQPPRLLTHQLGSRSGQLWPGEPGYTLEGKEGVLCRRQLPGAAAAEGGPAPYQPVVVDHQVGLLPAAGDAHMHPPPHCLGHRGQRSPQGSEIVAEYTRTPTRVLPAAFPTCPTLPALPLLFPTPSFAVLLGTPCLTHWVLAAAAG